MSLTCIVDSTSCYLVPKLAVPTTAKKKKKNQSVERKEDDIRTRREREKIVGKRGEFKTAAA